MPEKKGKGYGLSLDFPGAPATPHTVVGLEGEFSADRPKPLEECYFSASADSPVREVTLEEAKKLDADPGCPLKLVDLNPKE